MEENIFYEVYYRYYQYNDGSANNGTFTDCTAFDSIEDANTLADKIDNYDSLGEEGRDKLVGDLIPGGCGGYFIGKARILKVTRKEEEISRESKGFNEEEIDKDTVKLIESF